MKNPTDNTRNDGQDHSIFRGKRRNRNSGPEEKRDDVRVTIPSVSNRHWAAYPVAGLIAELGRLLRKVRSDPTMEVNRRRRIEKTILDLHFLLSSGVEKIPEIAQKRKQMPSKEEHFRRNRFMPAEFLPSSPQEAEAWGWDGNVACDCHQFTSPDRSNVKYVSPDGKSEVIFSSDGRIVTASEDYGTYNFANPLKDPIGHFYQDVVPWIIWGNDETDSTNVSQRLEAFVVYGGASALGAKLEELGVSISASRPVFDA